MQPPTLINCDNIGHYDIYYRTIDEPDWMVTKSAAGTTVQNVSGVLGNTMYIIRLHAVNNAKMSSHAVEASVLTASLPAPGTVAASLVILIKLAFSDI